MLKGVQQAMNRSVSMMMQTKTPCTFHVSQRQYQYKSKRILLIPVKQTNKQTEIRKFRIYPLKMNHIIINITYYNSSKKMLL